VVALEATGHYGKNLCAFLRCRGFGVAVINPIRTHRFAQEDLLRAKNDSIDALGIARFALQKRLTPETPGDPKTLELRELVLFRERLVQDFADKVRQLHRLVDLGFPEFDTLVRTLDSRLATRSCMNTPPPRPSSSPACESSRGCDTTHDTGWDSLAHASSSKLPVAPSDSITRLPPKRASDTSPTSSTGSAPQSTP